jgi:hypothetical protein
VKDIFQSGAGKLATGVGLGAAVGGPVGAGLGAIATSPLFYKGAIKAGSAASKRSGEIGSIVNQSVVRLDDGTLLPSIYDLLLRQEEEKNVSTTRK